MRSNDRFIHEISEYLCLITEQTLAGSEEVKCCCLAAGSTNSPRTSVRGSFVPVYNTQAESNMRYLVGKVWICGELQE